jgi:hypothetical protein
LVFELVLCTIFYSEQQWSQTGRYRNMSLRKTNFLDLKDMTLFDMLTEVVSAMSIVQMKR